MAPGDSTHSTTRPTSPSTTPRETSAAPVDPLDDWALDDFDFDFDEDFDDDDGQL